ncbi:hypothetical protein [Natronoarchaeum rubrum]|uniref:hypothetical protein n=1 Tax=Natronoarchaeum rubrum TaxID=755311 RepID=UPI002111FA20|nr:hypothetical protein [Natronoarchaeum rubrum]
MSTSRRSSGRLQTVVTALVVVVGLAGLGYTMITGASLLLGIGLASACGLYVVLDWRQRNGANTRRVEDTALVGLSGVVVLYALFTASLLTAIGVVALLWIGVNVARIERTVRAGDADGAATIDDAER